MEPSLGKIDGNIIEYARMRGYSNPSKTDDPLLTKYKEVIKKAQDIYSEYESETEHFSLIPVRVMHRADGKVLVVADALDDFCTVLPDIRIDDYGITRVKFEKISATARIVIIGTEDEAGEMQIEIRPIMLQDGFEELKANTKGISRFLQSPFHDTFTTLAEVPVPSFLFNRLCQDLERIVEINNKHSMAGDRDWVVDYLDIETTEYNRIEFSVKIGSVGVDLQGRKISNPVRTERHVFLVGLDQFGFLNIYWVENHVIDGDKDISSQNQAA